MPQGENPALGYKFHPRPRGERRQASHPAWGMNPAGSDRYHVLRNHLTRGQNRLEWTLRQAANRVAGSVM